MNLKEIINQDFKSSLKKAAKKAKMDITKAFFSIQITPEMTYLFIHQGGRYKQLHFTELIGQKIIALGMTPVEIYRVFDWLKKICCINHYVEKDASICFVIYEPKDSNRAVVAFMANNKHVESFELWDLIREYRKKINGINT